MLGDSVNEESRRSKQDNEYKCPRICLDTCVLFQANFVNQVLIK